MNLPTNSQTDALVGTVIDGRYQITDILSENPLASVYVARQKALDRFVVLKVFREKDKSKTQTGDVFSREARALSRLRHPHIITLYDHGVMPDGRLFLVLEHIVGEPLNVRIERGRLTVTDALCITLGIGRALEETHRLGIVHRDVTSNNVILESKTTPPTVRLIDYGIAATHVDVNTPTPRADGYSLPEVITSQTVDARADLYGLGSVLLEMLTGRVAHPGLSVEDIKRWIFGQTEQHLKLTQSLALLLATLLQEQPSNRPSSATVVLSQLVTIEEQFRGVPPTPWHEEPIQDGAGGQAINGVSPANEANRGAANGGMNNGESTAQNSLSSWLPRWRYIILLGIISAAGIGLVQMEKLSNPPPSQSRARGLLSQPGLQRILVESFVYLDERHTQLINGVFHPRKWLSTAFLWASDHFPVRTNAFGLTDLALPANLNTLEAATKNTSGKPRDIENQLARAAYGWAQANTLKRNKPDYSETIPILREIVSTKEHTQPKIIARFYLAHALRLSGQLEAAVQQWQEIVSNQINPQLSALARLNLVATLLMTASTEGATSHLNLLENDNLPKVRWAAQFLRPYVAFVDGRHETALDQGFTFIETASMDAQAPRVLISRMLEMIVVSSVHVSGGIRSVQSFLRGLGGRDYVRYFLPLQASALRHGRKWLEAGQAYETAAGNALKAGHKKSSLWFLRAADAYVLAGQYDRARPLMNRLGGWCSAQQVLPTDQERCAVIKALLKAWSKPDMGSIKSDPQP
jgi:serine/threonine protein kinase